MHEGGDDAEIIWSTRDVAGVELSAAPQFGLTVDSHLSAGDQRLGIGLPRRQHRQA
jgi:hypothetical protein